jgi:rare lipoprotein A
MRRELGAALVLMGCAGCAHREATLPEPVQAPTSSSTTTVATAESGVASGGDARTDAGRGGVPLRVFQVGLATWYGGKLAGHRTASGERFDPSQLTAAHRTLPFGTWVDVRRLDTGRTVRVRINDRGPFGRGDRVIDLSRGAAAQIDLVRAGVASVELRVVR